jgi:hypothetical protein
VTPDDNNFPRIVSNIAEVMKTILVKNDSTRYDDGGDNCKRKLTRIYKQELTKFNNFSRIVSINILKVMETYLVQKHC